MNLPNKITMFRIFMVPLFVLSMYFMKDNTWIPLLIFVIASISDALDGYIARKYSLITNFGKLMDPLADKILTITAMLMIMDRGDMPAWILVVILSREFFILGLRQLAGFSKIAIAASSLGKIKTITQMSTIIIYFLSLKFSSLEPVYNVFMYLMMVATVISGIDYLIKNKSLLED